MMVPPWLGTVLLAAAVVFTTREVSAVGVNSDPELSVRQQGEALAVGETVRLRLSTHGGPDVRFLLCGRSKCGIAKIRGIGLDGGISYRTYTNTNLLGNGGKRIEDVSLKTGIPLDDGDYTFLVKHESPHQMLVWLEGKQDKRIVVPVDPEFTNLTVRKRWSGSVKAEFIPPTGARRQGDRLSVGGSARVRVTATGDAFARFLFCSDEACSLVDVLGITADKRISYWTQTEADAEGYRGKFGKGGDLFVSFPSGPYEFVVERRSHREASVWLAARPDRVATVPLRTDSDRVFVKDPWANTVRVRFLRDGSSSGGGEDSAPTRKPLGLEAPADADLAQNTARVQSESLAVGETVRVRVKTHGSPDVRFMLCGTGSCGSITIRGLAPDGRMSFGVWTDADLLGNGGQMTANVENGVQYNTGFADGDHLFMVRRNSAREMTVWPDGKAGSESVATVRVSPDFSKLIVRRRWSGTVQVQFIAPTSGRRQGERLSVGESARVRLLADGDAFARFQLCSDQACSMVDVLGIRAGGDISFWTETDADHEGYRGRFGPGGDLFVGFPSGTHDFVVERRSERELAVWLASRPDRVAIAAVGPGMDKLTVKDAWRDTVKVEFLNVCGKVRGSAAELVLNGDPTNIESVPWHAALYLEKQGHRDLVCGGSLVTPCAVVTAAHCVPKDGQLYVALGKTLSGWDSEDGKWIHKTKVKKTIPHPFYRGFVSKLVYDIAILELEKCATLQDKVFPICVDEHIVPESAADVKVAGWGNESTVLVELESVRLSQLNFEDCFKDMNSNSQQLAFVTHDKFCAKRPDDAHNQVGLLQGDSGGGALVKRDGSWFLAGIVSVRLQNSNKEDIFALTDVSQYASWISQMAKW